MSDCLRPYGLQSARLLCPGDSPGKNTAMSCHFLLQGIFPTQRLNPGLQHCGQILYHVSYQESSFFPLQILFILLKLHRFTIWKLCCCCCCCFGDYYHNFSRKCYFLLSVSSKLMKSYLLPSQTNTAKFYLPNKMAPPSLILENFQTQNHYYIVCYSKK